MAEQRFTAMLAQKGSRVYLPIPFNPDQIWGAKARHHVTGSIAGKAIRGALINEDGICILPLGPAWRRDNGLNAGDTVEARLTAEGPQAQALAADIAAALEAEPRARAFFDALATFYRKGYLRWIDGARQPDARAARIAEMVELLKAGEKQRKP